MEANVRLYALNYDEVKTYLWATVFVACNLVLPQVFHLIPQGVSSFRPCRWLSLQVPISLVGRRGCWQPSHHHW